MEKDNRQLDLFEPPIIEEKIKVPIKEAKVISLGSFKEKKERQETYEWVLKNIPSY